MHFILTNTTIIPAKILIEVFNFYEFLSIFMCLLEAFNFLQHKKNIWHNDLKKV